VPVSEVLPGWYGKIASLGDFAGRRLPPEFVAAVDHWLQQVLTESRQSLGEGWLDAYLTAPVWRFVLFPPVIGKGLWAGILMPSVDKVGRYFPLLIAAELARLPSEPGSASLDGWLARLDEIALATLDSSSTPEGFDASLLACPAPAAADLGGEALRSPLARETPTTVGLPTGTDFSAYLAAAAMAALAAESLGRSLWWAPTGENREIAVISATGLPDGKTFATMLSGSLACPVLPPCTTLHE
jgi:type VI secretion system protein ImpM